MVNNGSRRNFLMTVPAAAAAGLALTNTHLLAATASEAGPAPAPEMFQVFTAETLAGDAQALQAKPGNNNLADFKTSAIVMTTEAAHSAKEFEWHESRDHIVFITNGSTVYEVGGTPKNARNTKPGEYLAMVSEGATKMTLKTGDMLTIPRGTPHKRSTDGSVTFYLISPAGSIKS